jgi:hypothetical protein
VSLAVFEPTIPAREHPQSHALECAATEIGNTRRVKKKDRNFAIKTLFFNILSTVPFKVAPSTGDIPFSTFLPLLDCFLERIFCDGAQFSYRIFCDGAQFSYRIFLNLRVFKKRPNFLNSALGRATATERT